MRELLSQWWAQQLTLCGWTGLSDPRRGLSPASAHERLTAIGIGDPDEFAWRLWESLEDDQEPGLSRLAGLELLALGCQAGWMPKVRETAWLLALTEDIVRRYPSLKHWLDALRGLNDPLLDAAGRELVRAERQGRGIQWSALKAHVEADFGGRDAADLWVDGAWRARAAFAPIFETPAGGAGEEQRRCRVLLRDELGIESRDALLASLQWLAEQGERYGWDMDAARLLRQTATERLEWQASLGDQQPYGAVMLQWLSEREPLDWAAWDWLRVVDQAYLGMAAGWLQPAEAEAFTTHALDLLQQRYTGWEPVARAYQRGRSLAEGRDLREAFDADWALLLERSTSPWHAPLSEILDDEARETSRRFIRERYAGADAWVLALASVREPDLTSRLGLDEGLDPARRQEAMRYLDEVLLLRADEGPEGLARFWMPAQAHHLNQLAADARTLPSTGSQPARRQLAGCAKHAATIVMAEKYAFYLLMAADSGRYSVSAIAREAERLCGVLSRFYLDPRRLLEAWSVWDETLSRDEDAEASLKDDIDWHRRDPGSRFHWLSHASTGTWQEPGLRPTVAQFTAVSLAGPLNEAAWQMPQPVGGEERRALGDWIEHQYALQGAEGLKDFLTFLIDAGDRQDYQINYAPYTLNRRRLDEEIAILESGDCSEDDRIHLLRMRHVRDNACHCNDEDMTAWDVAQAVDLALAGRQLNWLNASECEQYLHAASRLAERHYSSWQAYADGLYSGFGFFMDDTPEREDFLERFRQALNAWVNADPLLAGSWASLDFPGRPGRHETPLHIDVLPGEPHRLH